MSTYHVMYILADQSDFNPRVAFCCQEQSETYINDGRPAFVSLSKALLKGDNSIQQTFVRICVAGPGVAAKADTGEMNDIGQPIVDQTLISDGDILASVQANFPTVASLFFDDTGAPIP